MTLPDHIRISIDAVGGLDTEAGQEMMRLLAEREGLELVPVQSAIPAPAQETIEAPPTDEHADTILGPELEAMFQRVVVQDTASVPKEDPPGE